MGVVIFDVVIMWLIKDAVRIMVAIWVLISYSSSLTHWAIWIDSKTCISTNWHRACSWLWGIWSLASDQQDSFMETTDNWNFWLTLLGCWVLCSRYASIWLRCLLHRAALRICGLAFMLTLVGSAALRWLHAPFPFSWLVLWLVFLGRRSLNIILSDLVLRSTARSFFEKHLLILLGHWSILIWCHHAVIYTWNVSQNKGVIHGGW